MALTVEPLPHLRFEIMEAARILRMSRATLYERLRHGELRAQKDGAGGTSPPSSCSATSPPRPRVAGCQSPTVLPCVQVVTHCHESAWAACDHAPAAICACAFHG
jgi:hypothetical protein